MTFDLLLLLLLLMKLLELSFVQKWKLGPAREKWRTRSSGFFCRVELLFFFLFSYSCFFRMVKIKKIILKKL